MAEARSNECVMLAMSVGCTILTNTTSIQAQNTCYTNDGDALIDSEYDAFSRYTGS